MEAVDLAMGVLTGRPSHVVTDIKAARLGGSSLMRWFAGKRNDSKVTVLVFLPT